MTLLSIDDTIKLTTRNREFIMHHSFPGKAPTIRKWYQDRDRHQIFKVVAEDISAGLVEVQYFSGEIEELDFDTWFSLNLRVVPEPEDSSGPYELSQEDLGYDSEAKQLDNWSGVLSELEPENQYDKYDDKYEDKYEDKYNSYFDNFKNMKNRNYND